MFVINYDVGGFINIIKNNNLYTNNVLNNILTNYKFINIIYNLLQFKYFIIIQNINSFYHMHLYKIFII